MTVLDLIKRSMRLLGALSIGDNPTADEQADMLLALNEMTDAWATERLMMFTSSAAVYTSTAGLGSYSLGPNTTAPNWTAARPQYIDSATVLIAGTPGNYERPLKVIRSADKWARVRIKSLPSTLPTALYYQPDSPAATVSLWPVPSQSVQIVLYTPTAVNQFTGLTQVISLPPGYARALSYNLAVEVAGEFDREPSATVVEIAMKSKADLKRANVPATMGRLRVDGALRSNGAHWDWMTGDER